MYPLRRDLLLAGLVVILPGRGALAAASLSARCTRLSSDRLRITWSPACPLEIKMAHKAEGPFAMDAGPGAAGAWEGEAPLAPRTYFRLQSAAGTTETAERLLPLEGGRNFRDMGGYRGADGRMVKWGKLYRSGSMSELTARDFAYLDGLGIAVICDFRSDDERATEPTAWPGARAPRIWAREYQMPLTDLTETVKRASTPADARQGMLRLYHNIPYDHAESYRRLFHELAESELPLAFNCSAGKDRTGVAAALVLTALGVPRRQVLEDYSLSDKLVNYERVVARRPHAAGFGALTQLSPEMRAPLMRSDPEYLESALTFIEQKEGSIDGYLHARLGVTSAHTGQLRKRLLKRV